MKTNRVLSLVSITALLLLFDVKQGNAIGHDKTLFVELFATNIFNVDENSDGVYEREDALIAYAQAGGYNTLILNRLVVFPTFSKTVINYSAINTAFELRLADFLTKAHQHGITYIAAQGGPTQSANMGSYFFDNVNEFNKRMLPSGVQNCFDIIYTELDYWAGDPTANPWTNWDSYYTDGITHMVSVRNTSNTAQYHPLLIATYVGNFRPLANNGANSLSYQAQADFIDQWVDLIYVHFYFKGDWIPNNSPVEFFNRDVLNADGTAGSRIGRLLFFANNSFPSRIIPLFSYESSTDVNNNFFGDNVKYANGYYYNPGAAWNGTVDDITTQFENFYNTSTNPYSNGGTQLNQTLKQITETNAPGVPNDMSFGVGEFKHGCMPDINFYISMPADDLNVHSCPYTLVPDEIVDNVLHHVGPYLAPNDVNDANNDIPLAAGFTNWRWYKNGILQAVYDGIQNPSVPVVNGVVDNWTCEAWVSDPAHKGYFNELKIRADFNIRGDVPTVSINGSSLTICDGDNVTFTSNLANTGTSPTFQWFDNTVSIAGATSSSYSTSNLTPGTHSITLQMISNGLCTPVTTVSSPIVVTVHVLPTVGLNAFNDMCANEPSLLLTGGSPVGGIYSGIGVVPNGPDYYFDPSVSGTGTFMITYTYQDLNNCTNIAQQTITVNPLPIVTLAAFNDVCEDALPFLLIGGSPTGGVYSGTGVIPNGPDFNFDPSVSGAGTFTITYTYEDLNNCSNFAQQTITVNQLPSVTLATFSDVCADANSFVLTGGSPTGGSYYIDGSSFSSTTFDPASEGVGTHIIEYRYTDAHGCTNSQTQTLTVNDLPQVSLNNALPDICVNAAPLDLFLAANPTPSNGTFTGTGVSNNYFDPSTVGAIVVPTNFPITYSVTDGTTGCTNSAMTSITVNPLVNPVVTLDASPLAITVGDPVDLTVSINPLPTCANYQVELWWHHYSDASDHQYQTNVCTSCTFTIYPTAICDGPTCFETGDCFFIKYIPCDCTPLAEYNTDYTDANHPTCIGVFDGGLCVPNYYAHISELTPATCPSFNNGSFKVTSNYSSVNSFDIYSVVSGVHTWLYNQIASGSSGNFYTIFNNLPSGNYYVTASSASQSAIIVHQDVCTYDWTTLPDYTMYKYLTINQIDHTPNPQITTGHPGLTCSATLSTGNFAQWLWSPGNATTQSINATSSGTYSVIVTSATGCTASASQVVDLTNDATISGPATTCGNHIYSVPLNNNNATYQWSVPVGAFYIQSSNSITVNWGTVITTGGIISCTVTDACGNSSTGIINVSGFVTTLNSTNENCFNQSHDGTASINVSGGSGNYSYSWNSIPIQTTQTATGLSQGTYSVTVTDNTYGCQSSSSISIAATSNITFSTSATNVICNGMSTGSASVLNLHGGSGAYSYAWNPSGQTTLTATNLLAGTYNVTVTDAIGCSIIHSATVIQSSAITLSTSSTSETCYGQSNNGSATVLASGGTGGYTYLWSPSGATNATANHLTTGNYIVSVTDQTGCQSNSSVFINSISHIQFTTAMTPNICFGGNEGSAGLNSLSGGIIPYSYLWNTTPPQTTAIATNLTAGTYNLTVSDHAGCSVTQTQSVSQPDPLVLQTTVTPELCLYQSQDGTAIVDVSGGTPSYYYLWSNGETTADIGSLYSGSYNVVVTDENGCTTSSSVLVPGNAIPDPPDLIETDGIYFVCDNGRQWTYSITNFDPSYYYTWVVEDPFHNIIANYVGVQTANIDWITLNQGLLIGGYITVTVTNNGCDVSTTLAMQSCCPATQVDVASLWGNESVTHKFGYGTSTVTFSPSSPVYINGDFIIDRNFEFSNSQNIFMAPGSRIYVLSGYSFYLTNSTLQAGCNNMWKGVELQPLATFSMNGSTIQDAEHGIKANSDATGGSKYRITSNSIFTNNYDGILLPSTNAGIDVVDYMENVTFEGGSLIDPYLGQKDYGPTSYSGIEAYNEPNLQAYNFLAVDPNIFFKNLAYGIIAVNSSATVNHCSFLDIQPTPVYNSFGSGSGIFASGKYGILKENGISNQPLSQNINFKNCSYGIFCNHITSYAANNYMDKVGTGIFITNTNSLMNTGIYKNLIYANKRGVDITMNADGSNCEVKDNVIYMGYNGAAGVLRGINSSEAGGYLTNTLIANNTINLYGSIPAHGIVLENTEGNQVVSNLIYLNGTQNRDGLRVTNATKNILDCNTIEGLSSMINAGNPSTGLGMHLSPGNQVNCNHFNNVYTATRITQNCLMPDAYSGNVIQNHWRGIFMYYNGEIGYQKNRGNQWTANPYVGYGAYATVGSGTQSAFVVPSGCSYVSSSYCTNNFGVSFQNIGSNTPFDCNSYYCSAPKPQIPDLNNPISREDTLIAKDSLEYTDDFEESKYETDKYLYNKLQGDTSPHTDSLFQSFILDTKSKPIGKLNAVQIDVKLAHQSMDRYRLLIQNNISWINQFMDSIAINDSTIYNSSDSLQRLYLAGINENLNQTIQGLNHENDSIHRIVKEINDQKLLVANAQNRAIQYEKVFDYYDKVVNEIYISTVAANIYKFDDDQQQSLLDIASLCPLEGGPAVYRARALYSLIDETDFDDDEICLNHGFAPRLADFLDEKNANAFVFPNPSDKEITFNYFLPEKSTAEVNIFNSAMQLISKFSLDNNAGQKKVSVENISQGLYLFNIIQNGNVVSSGKFSIQH